MNIIKRICICVLLVLSFSLLTATAMADEDVTMRVKPGFNGVYKLQSLVMVQIIIDNKGSDLSGMLVFIPEEHRNSWDNTNYTMEVSVPAGETKKFDLLLPGEVIANSSKINLMSNDRIIAWSPLQGLQIRDGILIVGISERGDIYKPIVDSHSKGDFIRPITAKTIETGDLPQELLALRAVDIIVLDGELMDSILPNQEKAIESWVAGGGILIISQGDEKGKIIAENDGNPLLYRQPLGEGVTITSTFDLISGSELDREEELKLWWGLVDSELLIERAHILYANSWGNYWRYVDSANYFEDITPPNIVLYGFILAGYILLIGPILYLILRRFDRRDILWILIPVTAIILTLGIMGVGKNRLPGDGIVQIVSNINIIDPQTALVEGAAAAVIPKGGSYSFEIIKNTHATPVMRNRINLMDTTIKINEFGEQIIGFNRVEHWTVRNVYFINEHKGLGSIEGSLSLNENILKGTLINNTGLDLKDVLLRAGEKGILIGNWDAGNELKIAENLEWSSDEVLYEWEKNIGSYRGIIETQQSTVAVEYSEKYGYPIREGIDGNPTNPFYIPYTGYWDIKISGWADNDLGITKIAGLNVTNKSKHLVNQIISVDLNEENRVFFPWGYYKPVFKSNVEYDYRPGKREIIVQGTTIADFNLGPNLDIERIYTNFSINSTPALEVSVYNWQTDSWDADSDMKLDIITKENAHFYLNEIGVLRVRITNESGYRESIPEPAIQVLGRYHI